MARRHVEHYTGPRLRLAREVYLSPDQARAVVIRAVGRLDGTVTKEGYVKEDNGDFVMCDWHFWGHFDEDMLCKAVIAELEALATHKPN